MLAGDGVAGDGVAAGRAAGTGDIPHCAIVRGGGVGVLSPAADVLGGGVGVAPGIGSFASPGGISVAARVGGDGVGMTAIDGRPGGTAVSLPPTANASSQITRARLDANGNIARPKSSMVAKRALASDFIARSTISSSSGGMSGRSARGGVGVPPTIPWNTTNRLSPSYGRLPVRHS